MMDKTLVVLLLATTCLVDAADWSYSGAHGPDHWVDDYEKCGGDSQSPVNLKDSVFDASLGTIAMTNYNTAPASMILHNTGHGIQVDITPANGSVLSISGGKLPATYNLGQFHFHWGSDDSQGSEHTVGGKKYPMEVHFVHYKSSYSGIGEAIDKDEGLAVVGFFFEISDSDNSNLDEIVNHIDEVKYDSEDSVSLTPFALNTFLPSDRGDFYRYPGSLTTPSCDESVVWTIFRNTIQISEAQIVKFRETFSNAEGEDDERMVNNYRPVQDINSRTITTSFQVSSAIVYQPHFMLAALTALLVIAITRHQ